MNAPIQFSGQADGWSRRRATVTGPTDGAPPPEVVRVDYPLGLRTGISAEVVGTTLIARTILSAATLAAAIYLTAGMGSRDAHRTSTRQHNINRSERYG